MLPFSNNIVYILFISFGIIIGASFFAGMAAVVTNNPPLKTMIDISSSIKIWAVAVALGGTLASFQIIEQGLLKGEVRDVLKQVIYIVAAVIGANIGCAVIKLLKRCANLWQG